MKLYFQLLIIITIIILSGCTAGKRELININIPDIDNTDYSDPFFKDGWANLKEGKVDLAYENFRQSNSSDKKLYTAFGYVYLMKRKFGMSKRNFNKSLEIEPDDFQASAGLATIHEVLEEKKDAFLIYSNLLSKYPENPWIKVRYEFIKSTETQIYLKKAEEFLQKGESDNYVNNLKEASYYSPELTDIKLKIGDHYFENSEFENSIMFYENALENQPNNTTILEKLAETYEKSEKYDSSIVFYKRLLKIRPGDIDLTNRVNDLKIKFHEVNLPVKFKDIFFKENLNREELAALIGFYFDKYLTYEGTPKILTDIGGSFAKGYIIKVCSTGIMKSRPDHTFGRFPVITRSSYAVILNSLIKFLEKKGMTLKFTPLSVDIEPVDMTPLFKNYKSIKFLIKSQILKTGENGEFNPTGYISPSDILISLRKIIKSIEK
ncbi:MAG: hypothetical protein ABFR75_01260 [Acidobacteriota bacterium]